MTQTKKILEEVVNSLKEKNQIATTSLRSVGKYFGISHTAIHKMINNDRITIKFYKLIKTDEALKHINISEEYIINNILMGL